MGRVGDTDWQYNPTMQRGCLEGVPCGVQPKETKMHGREGDVRTCLWGVASHGGIAGYGYDIRGVE